MGNRLLLAFALLASCAHIPADPRDLSLSWHTPLLGHHLEVALPWAMSLETDRDCALYLGAECDLESQRAHLDGRFEMEADEMHALAGSDLRATVQSYVDGLGRAFQGSALETLPVEPPLRGFGFAPAIRVDDFSIRIYTAIFASADGTLQKLDFFVKGAQPRDPGEAGFAALARRIARTAEAGSRVYSPKAREHRLRLTASWTLAIAMPKGYVDDTGATPHSTIFNLHKLVPGEPGAQIFIDYGPRVLAGSEGKPIEEEPGRLLGRDVRWSIAKTDSGFSAEVFLVDLPVGYRDENVEFEVYCAAASREELEQLRAAAEGMRLESSQ